MPVLDAKALKTDPKGAAFLLSVLRRSPQSHSTNTSEPSPAQTPPIKHREERLHDSVTGL
jgi:hypothetical protein